MPNYLREWNKRTILVRPTKWNGAEELSPWDCLDITGTIGAVGIPDKDRWDHYIIPPHNPPKYGWSPIIEELWKNYSLYRSPQFCKKHAGNPRMGNPLFGCCVVATEALYFLIGKDMKPRCRKALDAEGIWHWWLEMTFPPRTVANERAKGEIVNQLVAVVLQRQRHGARCLTDGKRRANIVAVGQPSGGCPLMLVF